MKIFMSALAFSWDNTDSKQSAKNFSSIFGLLPEKEQALKDFSSKCYIFAFKAVPSPPPPSLFCPAIVTVSEVEYMPSRTV